MGFGIVVGFATIVGLLVLASSSSSSSSAYPSAEQTAAALCDSLAELGEVAPLPPSAPASADLAIRAIVRLGVLGSWPPPRNSSGAAFEYWERVLRLAEQVRAGEIVCVLDGDELDDGDDELDDGDDTPAAGPTADQLREAVCALLLPLADARTAYIEAGTLPPDQGARVAREAWAAVAGAGVPFPASAAWLATFAGEVLDGVRACVPVDRFITINSPRGPGGWVQLEKDVAGRTDELDDLASLVDLYPGMKAATGSQRLAMMRLINDHPYNAGLRIPAVQAWTKTNIGANVISFMPKWRANPSTYAQRFEPGSAYAVAYLPRVTL